MDLQHGVLLFLIGIPVSIGVFIILMKFEEHIENSKKEKPHNEKFWWLD